MKNVFAGLTIALLASCNGAKNTDSSVAAASSGSNLYRCDGFADIEEYRAEIDLKKNEASFFDNDSTSVMKLVLVKSLESSPPQMLMIFEGKDVSASAGKLRLSFNKTRSTASISSIDSAGKSKAIGSATCEKVAR